MFDIRAPHCTRISIGCDNHSYLIEVDCFLGQFKSAKLKDKEHTINAPSFFSTLQKRKRLMHQVFIVCGPMVGCKLKFLMLYFPLLDICGDNKFTFPFFSLPEIRLLQLWMPTLHQQRRPQHLEEPTESTTKTYSDLVCITDLHR